MSDGDQFTFNGNVSQSVIGGHHNVQNNHGAADGVSDLQLAAQLLQLLRADSPALVPTAEAVHAELEQAAQDGAEPDRGRLRGFLDLIIRGVTAGTAAATAAEGLFRALGG
ncbi:hypothetical protein [Kitasatospora azatica]|uniref:hypothetical protein n=1 Tax=Kitasatospora azatica TaxID=58347 RepID=UPI0005640FB7|nr:hypothetical protein [Kitasatospora azatica]